MKKIYSLLVGLVMVYGFSACSDDDYTDKYKDPSKTNTASCDKLMTGVFYTGAEFTYNSYWRMYTWENGGVSKYAQTVGFTNSEGDRYTLIDRYTNARWQRFYNILTQFRELQATYEKLPDAQKGLNLVFYLLSEIYIYDHLSQLIDAYGDVPFHEAGMLTVTNDLTSSYPSYDKATDLYTMMLDNLGTIYQQLNSGISTSGLAGQDFINKGDMSKWMKYCNSLRLRLATRVASQGALADKGRQVIREILDNNYPLVDGLNENIIALSFDDGDSSTGDPAGLNFGDGIMDGFKDHRYASQTMLDVMLTEETLGQNDPRLQVMYSKNAKGEYKGLSTRDAYATQQANTSSITSAYQAYAQIDSTTIIYNRNLKSPIATAAEVYLTKAEAYQKGWASGSAKDAFVKGILESTKYWYDMNATTINTKLTETTIRKYDMPAESDVTAYAEKMWDAASNKEELIAVQKWLNFGYLQGAQAWNEVRRTGYPVLYFSTDDRANVLPTPPGRIIYPTSESMYNTENYQTQIQAMGGTDDYYSKLFWAK